MKYKLNPLFTLRKTDKAVFNFSRAELTQFNDTGFDILLAILEQESSIPWRRLINSRGLQKLALARAGF